AYNRIETTVQFQDSWKNNTGYLDGLINADLDLKSGSVVKTVDDYNRKVIIVGTELGNVVVFERYTRANDAESVVVVHNAPDHLRTLIPHGAMSEETFNMVVGYIGNPNIGQTIDRLVKGVL